MKSCKFIKVLFLSLIASLMLNCTKKNHEGHKSDSAKAAAKTTKYVCPMHPQITSDKKGSCSICGMDLVVVESEDEADDGHSGHDHAEKTNSKSKVAKYICPMHPQITSDKKGSCSICGMDLILTEDESEIMEGDAEEMSAESTKEPEGHASFKLKLNKEQMIGVKIAQVEKRKLFKTIRAPGRIAFDPALYTAQSEYLEALKQWSRIKESPIASVRQSTQEMIKSTKIRLKILGLSDSEIKRLGRKGSQSEALLLSGKKQKSWVYADIYEIDLPYMKEGLSVEVTASFLQGKKIFGKVISVDEVINPETRTAKVRIQLKESELMIRPESYVSVSIMAPLGEHLTVPLESIMDTGREIFVFVKKDKGRYEPRLVSVIIETDSHVALVPKNLSEGESVVVGANFMLDSESRLKSVIRGSSSDGSSGHNH